MAPKNTKSTETSTETSTEVATTDAKPQHPAKGTPRPQAVVDSINFDDVAGDEELTTTASPRKSKWIQVLTELYDGTAAGKVARNEDGSLKFVRLGEFHNPGGARTQVKAFEDKGLDTTYEFKTVVKGHDSYLWARVREVADTPE